MRLPYKYFMINTVSLKPIFIVLPIFKAKAGPFHSRVFLFPLFNGYQNLKRNYLRVKIPIFNLLHWEVAPWYNFFLFFENLFLAQILLFTDYLSKSSESRLLLIWNLFCDQADNLLCSWPLITNGWQSDWTQTF